MGQFSCFRINCRTVSSICHGGTYSKRKVSLPQQDTERKNSLRDNAFFLAGPNSLQRPIWMAVHHRQTTSVITTEIIFWCFSISLWDGDWHAADHINMQCKFRAGEFKMQVGNLYTLVRGRQSDLSSNYEQRHTFQPISY